MQNNIKIAVFGSSQPKPGTKHYEDARAVGHAIAQAGWTVVSGGYRGVMEGVSRGASEAGGHVIGVTTAYFDGKILGANEFVDTEIKEPSYAERLLKLIGIADGYVVMRGGSGTLSEFFLAWELIKNKSLPPRPIVLFGEHWQRIIDFLAAELADELSFARFLDQLKITGDREEVVEYMRSCFK